MKVACIQMRAGSVFEYDATYRRILDLVEEAGKGGAQMAVLPECAYAAYFLGLDLEKARESLARNADLLDKLSELARRHDMYIAAGLVTERDGVLYNSAVMIDPEGRTINAVDKSNMWHFDSRWFRAAETYGVFETRYGTMGIIVCADGRLPEISRILALDGAKVIIDLVNLAAAASDPKMLSNQQYQFILPARAAENGVWMAVADKVGLEGGCASYLGRSMVIAPDGEIVACASTDREEILYHEIDPDRAGKPAAIDRKPELYGLINQPNDTTPAAADVEKRVVMKDGEVFTTTSQFRAADMDGYVEKAAHYLRCCDPLGSRLILLPQAEYPVDRIVERLMPSVPDKLIAIAAGRDADGVKCAVAFTAREALSRWRKTHAGSGGEPVSSVPFHCLETDGGKLGVIFDEEAYVPEIARCYMLLGCNILLWADCAARTMNTKMMQTRAAENKIFVVRGTCDGADSASVCDTEGRILTATFQGTEQAASGMILYPLSLSKSVVPGTDVLFGRRSGSYGRLTSV